MRASIIAGVAVAASGMSWNVQAAPVPGSDLCDGAFAQVSAVSDYRFDGFSESDRHPSWQATGYCYGKRGYFVGATFTGVNFLDRPRTHFEADWYAGRQFQLGAYIALVDVFYATFPDKRAPGPSYDIVEPQVELARTLNQRLTLKGQAGWTPNDAGAGPAWHLKGSAALRLARWLVVSGEAGRYIEARAGDHDHWDIGATASWRRVSLDMRYGGTDLPRGRCFFTDWCSPGPYATLSYRLLP